MQTRHAAPEIADERLDWFTYDIEPDGTEICAIRPARKRSDGVVPDRRASQLLQVLLNEIAQDNAIPFPQARQVVLRALRRAHNQHHPTD
jgi:hypothetical protein